MYHYIYDKEFLSEMKGLCGDIMQTLCHILKQDYDIGAIFYLVGSGARNLIMQNESEPIDLDYNLEIAKCGDFNNCRMLKECVRKAFNKALNAYGWSECQDSTSSLTTEKRYFTTGNATEFSIDVAIVTKNNGQYYRLKHKKTGHWQKDNYYWNIAPNSKKLKARVKFIKNSGKWELVREQYKLIKNRYLSQNDHNHPSFICYIEAVNNVFNSRGDWK